MKIGTWWMQFRCALRGHAGITIINEKWYCKRCGAKGIL